MYFKEVNPELIKKLRSAPQLGHPEIIKPLWDAQFDSKLDVVSKAEIRSLLRSDFERRFKKWNPKMPGFEVDELPCNTILVPIMVGGYLSGVRTAAFLSKRHRDIDFVLLGSTRFAADGNPISIAEEDHKYLVHNSHRPIILVDDYNGSRVTQNTVKQAVETIGFRDIYYYSDDSYRGGPLFQRFRPT